MAADIYVDENGNPSGGAPAPEPGADPRRMSTPLNEQDLRLYFTSLVGRPPTAAELAQYLGGDRQATYDALVALKGQEGQAAPQAPPPSGTGGPSGPSLVDPYTQPFTPPAPVNLGGPAGIPYIPPTPSYTAPTFTPPAYTPPPAWSYKDFQGPDAQTVLNTPGYKFRLQQGEEALQNAKAAQGILGTGATLKAILGYGQDYASNEFQNEWGREFAGYNTNRQGSLDAYNTNYQTQYANPYKFSYQGALDAFAPQMAQFSANVGAGNLGYSTQAAAGQRQTENDYLNAWNAHLFDYDKFRDQRDSTFNKQFAVLGA